MNPTFNPPPPLADTVREEIYKQYMKDPKNNNIRVLSSTYGLSIKRVDAILRLKGLERSWKVSLSAIYFAMLCAAAHDDLLD